MGHGVQLRVGPRPSKAPVVHVGSLSERECATTIRGDKSRLGWPGTRAAFSVGVSAARGVFIADSVKQRGRMRGRRRRIRARSESTRNLVGPLVDQGEYVVNSWAIPPLDAPRIVDPLGSHSAMPKPGSACIRPVCSVRGDVMRFTKVEGSAASKRGKRTSHASSTAWASRSPGLLLKASVSEQLADGGGASAATWAPCRAVLVLMQMDAHDSRFPPPAPRPLSGRAFWLACSPLSAAPMGDPGTVEIRRSQSATRAAGVGPPWPGRAVPSSSGRVVYLDKAPGGAFELPEPAGRRWTRGPDVRAARAGITVAPSWTFPTAT